MGDTTPTSMTTTTMEMVVKWFGKQLITNEQLAWLLGPENHNQPVSSVDLTAWVRCVYVIRSLLATSHCPRLNISSTVVYFGSILRVR